MWLTLFLIRPECIKNASPLECKNRLFICSFRLTRKMSFREISRRRRYVCSAHQWPFRHHHPPVAFSPSPHTRGDGALAVAAVPSFQHGISPAQRRRGAVATFAPHTRGLFSLITTSSLFRPHRTPVATAPSPSRQFPASNTAYHPHSDGEAPSLRLLRTPMAFSPSPHTRGDGALAVAAVPSTLKLKS